MSERSTVGPSRWLCFQGNAPLRKACRVWELSFQILIKFYQAKRYQCAFHEHWVLQPISILFNSSLGREPFGFLSRSCQMLSQCFSVSSCLSNALESAHILEMEDHPRLSPADGGLRQSWKVQGSTQPKGACREPNAVGQPEVPDTRANLQPCLACSPLKVASDGNRDKLFSSSQAAKGLRPRFVPRWGQRVKRCFLTRGKSCSLSCTKG